MMFGASHTFNLGSYNSMRVEASITVDVPDFYDTDLYIKLKEQAQAELKVVLKETYETQKRNPNGRL